MRFVFVPLGVLAVSLAVAAPPTTATATAPDSFNGDLLRLPLFVHVLNWPDVQAVSGTVSVENLPAVQSVSGTVSVGNLPLAADGSLRVAPTLERQPVVVELLSEPLLVHSGVTSPAPLTINTVGYSSFGILVIVPSGGAYAQPRVEWRWASDEAFSSVIENRTGNYGAPGILGPCTAPANARMLCNVAGTEMRVSVYNTGPGSASVESIRIYLIP